VGRLDDNDDDMMIVTGFASKKKTNTGLVVYWLGWRACDSK